MNKWDRLYQDLEDRLTQTDRQINLVMEKSPINHNSMMQLQVRNAETYRTKLRMEMLEEIEVKDNEKD